MAIVYIVISYIALSSLQKRLGMFYFGSFSNYFISKIILSAFLGWIVIPVWIIMLLLGRLR